MRYHLISLQHDRDDRFVARIKTPAAEVTWTTRAKSLEEADQRIQSGIKRANARQIGELPDTFTVKDK